VNVPSGARITSSWNGTPSGSTGAVSYTPVASWNAPVSPSSPKSFGFQGTGSPSGMTLSCSPA
jgi:endo-1,4-beta-xylanase